MQLIPLQVSMPHRVRTYSIIRYLPRIYLLTHIILNIYALKRETLDNLRYRVLMLVI